MRCFLGWHHWTPWKHVDLPVLYNLQTGRAITGPYQERYCARCLKRQEQS